MIKYGTRGAASDGGVAGLIHQAQIIRTNAQIKTLNNAPLTLVAALPATKQLQFVSGTTVAHMASDTGYGGGGNFLFCWSNGAAALSAVGTIFPVSDMLPGFNGGNIGITCEYRPLRPPVAQPFGGEYWSGMSLACFVDIANPTGGHADDTLVVSMLYHIFDVTTGVYE